MNQAELNRTWIRWLDNRPVNQGDVLGPLIDELAENESFAEQLLEDLDMHRQLQALGQIEPEDFSFVGRMMVRFETDAVSSPGDRPISTTDTKEVTPVVGDEDDSTLASGLPSVVDRVELAATSADTNGIAKTGTFSDAANRHSIVKCYNQLARPETESVKAAAGRRWALVLCVVVLAGLFFAAYELGRQTALNQQIASPPASESSLDNQLAESQTDEKANDHVAVADQKPHESENHKPELERPDAQPLPPRKIQIANNPATDQSNQGSVADVLPNRLVKDSTFATIEDNEDAVWSVRPATYPRVGGQALSLVSGQASIEFDRGGAITLTGPSRLVIDRDFVDIQSGQVTVDLPDFGGNPFAMQARTNRIEPIGNTRFAMTVEPEGKADFRIDQGAITVNPWYGKLRTDPMSLTPSGYNQLKIDGDSGDQPAVARLSGKNGQFEGWVNFNGQLLKSENGKLVDEVLRRARSRFEESPVELEREWRNLIDMVMDTRQPFDQQFQSPEIEEIRKRIQEMMDQMGQPGFEFPDFANGADGEFSGGFSFNFNGDDIEFRRNNRNKDMQKQMFGSFADLVDELRK